MLKFGSFNKIEYNGESISDIIKQIRSGNKQLKEYFINDYRQFILVAVSRASGKYIDTKNSEEYSVGMSAFNEAVDCYNEDKNSNFFTFSEQVIKRRIIDYLRSNHKNNQVYPFTYFENEDDNGFEEKYFKYDYTSQFESIETKDELLTLRKSLWQFGITFEDLILFAPKHKDSIKTCIVIARTIVNNTELYDRLIKKKNLPMVDLMKLVKVHQRTVERNRKFIIALTLILKSGLSVLKGYIEKAEEGR